MRTLIQAFRTKELRNKILFVLGIIIIYRIGSFIPTPGVDYKVVNDCVANTTNNAENFIGLVNLFSGGAMLQLSIFALGVMPYITASIVVQLLRAVIPRFEALHKEGQSGEAKLTQYTRYLTIGLAVLQSTTILVTARSGALFNYQCNNVIPDASIWNMVVMIMVMTGGTGLIMWVNKYLANTTSVWYICLYALMIVFFTFFYTEITFNPDETADNMKQFGGFIPGIRAGSATSRYLKYVINRLNTVGAIYLLFVALLPTVLIMALKLNTQLPFGGTTLLIIAGVGLDTLRQAKAQTEQYQYAGFLFENTDHTEGKAIAK